jgi:hypothetical protein
MNTLWRSPAKLALVILAAGSLALMGGCFVPLKYDVSVLQEIPAGFEGEIHKDIAELNFPELTLLAQVQSFHWSGSYMIEPLGVWLQFNPLDGPVTLDTRSVMLKSDSAEPLQAISYLGPGTAWWSPRAFAAGCGPRIYRSGISITNSGVLRQSVLNAGGLQGVHRISSEAISIDSKSCFMFWFETDPLPDHVFVLSISGVTKSGREVLIPELRFEKGAVSTVRGFP